MRVDKATHIDKTVVVLNIITTVSSQYATSYDINGCEGKYLDKM